MPNRILRRIFTGFMSMHILHHAAKEAIYGAWMIEELAHHGYRISAGTLYPMLHDLTKEGLLECEEKLVGGKIRKYYTATEEGKMVLKAAKEKVLEFIEEDKQNDRKD